MLTFEKFIHMGFAFMSLTFSVDPHRSLELLKKYWLDILDPSHCVNQSLSNPINILIFGDSINRLMVNDGCKSIQGKLSSWGEDNFTYHHGSASSIACTTTSGTIGFLNIYGMNRNGPYANNHTNCLTDPYADTNLRVLHGLDIYKQKFGSPSLILLRSDVWDMAALINQPSKGYMNSVLIKLLEDLKFCNVDIIENAIITRSKTTSTERMKYIEKYLEESLWQFSYIKNLAPNATIATHSIPLISWGLELFFQTENALRRASIEKDIVLYDFQMLFTGTPQIDYLRDIHHPKEIFTSSFFNVIVTSWKIWNCAG